MAASLPPQAAQQLMQAARLIQQAQLDPAEGLLTGLIHQFPNCADAHYLRGAIASQRNDQPRALEAVQRALQIDRHNAGYHFQAGMILDSLGRHADAALRYRDAARINPAMPEAHYNLALALQTTGDQDGALAAYRAAVARRPDFVEALNNLGNILLARGQYAEALEALQRAIVARPGFHVPYNNYGNALVRLQRRDAAIAAFRKALEIAPDFIEALANLAEQSHLAGNHSESIAAYERLLVLQPDNENARFELAALRQENPPAPPESFVRKLFDDLAPTFDKYLVETLDYRVPQSLVGELKSWLDSRGTVAVLDLGCGTGLFGQEVKPWSKRLAGIDLSSEMVAKARARGVYDDVQAAEIGAFMSGVAAQSVDLVAASDVFVYVGDLSTVFHEAARVLARDGRFAFSVENLDAGEFSLRTTSRYAHSRSYVDRLAAEHGLRVVSALQTPIRKEKGVPIEGCLYVLEPLDG
jgi:predicted TPR repeat methyltransferase